MRSPERTAQQLDPIGILAGMPLIVLIAAAMIGYALYSTFQQEDQVSNPPLAILSLALIAAVAVLFVFAAGPARSPLGPAAHVVLVVFALLAAIAFTASLWGTNRLVQDDWGQVDVAVLLLGLSLFRPPAEIVVSASFSAIVLGAVAMSESPFLAVRDSPWVYGTVVAAPVLIVAFAAAVYARVVIGALVGWQARAEEALDGQEPEVRASMARVLQQQQVTLVNEEAAPFLTRLIRRGTLTKEDAVEAHRIADRLRESARAEADDGWLRHVLPAEARLHDPRRFAEALDDRQRSVLIAFLQAVARLPRGDDPLTVDVAGSGERNLLVVSASATARDAAVRSRLVPYLSVFRQVSTGAALTVRNGRIVLRFEYGRA